MSSKKLPFVLVFSFLLPNLVTGQETQLNAYSNSFFGNFAVVFDDTGDGQLQLEEIVSFTGVSGVSPNSGQLVYDGISYVPDIPGFATASGVLNPNAPCAPCWEFTPSNFGDVSDGWFATNWTYTLSQVPGPNNFSSTVISAFGPLAGLFQAGDPVDVSLFLDQSVGDTNPAPDAGVFPNATIQLAVDFPNLQLAIRNSGGNVQTFDNTPNPDDQIFIFANNNDNGASLGGELIVGSELDFTGNTDMLSSDQIIAGIPSNITRVTLFIATASGWTQVEIAPPIITPGGSAEGFFDESDFLSSVVNPGIIDFEDIAPPGGFVFFGNPGNYSEAGVTVTNNSQMFVQNNNLYGTGGFLSPQGANPHIVNVDVPAGTRAVGFSYQSAAATAVVDGGQAFQLPAVPVASLGFFGVISDQPIQSLQITISGPGMDLDNIYFATDTSEGPVITPGDDCTFTAEGCNPTGLHNFALPEGFEPPPGAEILQNVVPVVDERADANGRCDGQTPLVLFDGDLILPEYTCGSPDMRVIVTDANFFVPEGSIESEVFPEEFVSNDFECNVPVTGDPQNTSLFVWQPTNGADVIEGTAIDLTNGCGSSRGRMRGFSYIVVGLHYDFGLDYDDDPEAVTQAFIDLTSTKLDNLVQAVRNARPALKRYRYRYLLRLADLSRRLHNRGKYQLASRYLEKFLWKTEFYPFEPNEEINHEGNLLSRGDNIRFLLDEFIIPVAPNRRKK